MLELQPITLEEARQFVNDYHRHSSIPHKWKFGIGVHDGEKLVGVVVVGRPISKSVDDGWTLEVLRCCTDGTKNAGSMLYAAAWRAARAMGYRRMVTYTLLSEPGTTLRAAGWQLTHQTEGSNWNRKGRPFSYKDRKDIKNSWEKRIEG